MQRLQDWPARLSALIERRRRMPFKYGVHDCCQFARAAVQAQTGIDPADTVGLQAYRTHSAATVQLRRLGGIEVLPSAIGLEEVPVSFAQRGAIVLLHHAAGRPEKQLVRLSSLGICLGEHSVFPARRGLVFHCTAACAQAWRVG